MRKFHCREIGPGCHFVARGSTDPEVLEHARQHALEVHGMRIDLELERRVLGLIHDEESDAHRQAMGGLIP
jgi:predicted small metal-binding protein